MIKERNSNIEMLRIISMFFIVLSHCVVHSNFSVFDINNNFNRCVTGILTLGNIGVILFSLITGYYSINSSKTKLNKIVDLSIKTIFYSYLVYLIIFLFDKNLINVKNTIRSLFPIISYNYWFVSTYIVLYIFMPYINKMLNLLSKKDYCKLIVVSLIIISILPTFTGQNSIGNDFIHISLFYMIGGFIKKYGDDILHSKYLKISFIITTVLLILSVISFVFMSNYFGDIFLKHFTHFLSRHSILSILFSTSLFCIFINMKTHNNRVINLISSSTFGIYLIHENIFCRYLIWECLIKIDRFINSNYLIAKIIISAGFVFILCFILDYFISFILNSKLMVKLKKNLEQLLIKLNLFI